MTKAANNRSSIYKGNDGCWHGWVSFGEGADGRRRRKHVRGQTKREVAEKVQRLERQRAGGYLGDLPLTVNEWLELWIEMRVTAGARTKAVEGYRTGQRHISRVIGAILFNRLSAEHIDRLWISIMTSRAGPATCAHVRRTLCAALTAAVERGHMAKNPVPLSQSPRYEPPEVEPFTKADARRVLDTAAGRRNSARWTVALALGLRQGEALGLCWTDVDLDEARLLIRVQLFHPPWQHGCLNPEGQPTCDRIPAAAPLDSEGNPS
jgi:hypothetical protein